MAAANRVFLSDMELVDLIRSGDKIAFAEIYERYWAVLFIHARHMCRDEEAAKDTVQEVFIDLLERAGRISLTTSLKAYLYTAVRNRTLDYLRKSGVAERYAQHMVGFGSFYAPAADASMHYRELERDIESGIEQLPVRMREIFRMSREGGQSPSEIASELQISVQAVHKAIAKALQNLAAKLLILLILFFL